MRKGLLPAILLTAACSSGPPAIAAGTEHVPCALAGASKFAPKCSVERVAMGGQNLLIVRHPDGGFRRFVVSPDGRELAAADGADQVALSLSGKAIEVRVDLDAYRFAQPLAGNAAR